MSKSSKKTLAFRVRVNGKILATAGIPGAHVLTAIVTSVVRDNEARRNRQPGRRFRKRELHLYLGGLVSDEHEFVHWANMALRAGDRVAIQVVEASKVDTPKRKRKSTRRVEKLERKISARVRKMRRSAGARQRSAADDDGADRR